MKLSASTVDNTYCRPESFKPEWKSELVQIWTNLLPASKAFVLFEHGTCVIFDQSSDDIELQAKEILHKWGRVHVGSPAGDFNVLTLRDGSGWLITSHNPNVVSYVGSFEVTAPGEQDLHAGLLGRSKRDLDANELSVLYVHSF